MAFNELNSVEYYIIHQLSGVNLNKLEISEPLGSIDVKIENDAISVASSESSANIIVWRNNKYVWLHTGD